MRYPFLLPLLLLAGCAAAQSGAAPAVTVHDVQVEFRIENVAGRAIRHFSPNETARFVVALMNRSNAPQTLAWTFPPHRIVVTSNTGAEVWHAFHGRMFPQVMRQQTLAPGETLRFTADWNFHPDDAPQTTVPAGDYQVQARLIAFARNGEQPLRVELPPVALTVSD